MITKYRVTIDTSTLEFATQQEAEDYRAAYGQGTEPIDSFEDDAPAVDPRETFLNSINTGYYVPSAGFYLDLRDDARVQFTSMTVLLQQCLSAGLITLSTPQEIRDRQNVARTLTTGQLLTVLIGYGNYYKQLWDNYHAQM